MFVAIFAIRAIFLGLLVVGVLWIIQRIRRIGPLERCIAILESQARQAEVERLESRSARPAS